MIREDVREAIEQVLGDALADIGYEKAEIVEDVDHDGDSILRITVHYNKLEGPVDPSPTFSLARLVKDKVRPLGEERFPHFRHLFPDDQKLKVA
jgi:hypothetical protein